MDLGIAGKAALVTAASKGLGLGTASALAAEGCRVAINGRDERRLEAAAATLPGAVAYLQLRRTVARWKEERAAGRRPETPAHVTI